MSKIKEFFVPFSSTKKFSEFLDPRIGCNSLVLKTSALVFLVLLVLISSAAVVYAASCTQPGSVTTDKKYCNSSLVLVAQKDDGVSCANGFECINGSCLEGTCTKGYKAEIAKQRSLLEQILALIQREAVGAKEINPGSPVTFSAEEIGVSSSPLTSVTIKTNTAAKAAVGASDLGSSAPSAVTVSPPGIAYRYMEIATYQNIANKIDSADIIFRVPKSWFTEKNADANNVNFYRWSSSWTKLTVTKQADVGEYASYKAVSPGFSIFAITAASLLTQTTQNVNVQATCYDGIQNQDETSVDCGGTICSACSGLCGNGIVEEGETCKSCALEFKCAEGEICSYNKCIKKPFPFWTAILAFIIGGAISFFSIRFVKGGSEKKKRDIARLSSTITYIVNASKSGAKDDDIKNNLLKAGWNTKQVSLAFKEANKLKR